MGIRQAFNFRAKKYNFSIKKFIQGSILDTKLLKDINNQYRIDTIYHLAAILSTNAELNPIMAHNINVGGFLNIIEHINKSNVKLFLPSSMLAPERSQR